MHSPALSAFAFALTGSVLSACGSQSSPTTPGGNASPGTTAALFKGISAALTGDATLGAVAANPAGEQVGVATQSGTAGQVSRVTGATLRLPDGSNAVVFVGADGLPTHAVFGDIVVLFSGYTSSSVNIEAVTPAGIVHSAVGVAVNPSLLAVLKTLTIELGSLGNAPIEELDGSTRLGLVLKIAGTALSIAGCAVAASSVAATAGGSIIIASGACLSAVANVLTLINPSLDSAGLAASGLLMSAATCASGSGVSCLSVVVSGLKVAEGAARSRVSSVPPSTPASTSRYVVSSTALYLSDFSATGSDSLVGTIRAANGVPVDVTDIAVAPNGAAFVISFDRLFSIHLGSGIVTPISLSTLSGVNALTTDASGNLWAAAAGDGALYRVSSFSGAATLIGRFGSGWVSSGDLAFDSSGALWATARRPGDAFDTLVTVNTSTGVAASRGAFLPSGIYGLIFANGTLYGLSSSTSSLYTVNPTTGVATFVRKLAFEPYGTSNR